MNNTKSSHLKNWLQHYLRSKCSCNKPATFYNAWKSAWAKHSNTTFNNKLV